MFYFVSQFQDAKQCLPWLPSHMIHTSPDSAAAFALQYDRHGDSYTDDVTAEKLKQVLESVTEEVRIDIILVLLLKSLHRKQTW